MYYYDNGHESKRCIVPLRDQGTKMLCYIRHFIPTFDTVDCTCLVAAHNVRHFEPVFRIGQRVFWKFNNMYYPCTVLEITSLEYVIVYSENDKQHFQEAPVDSLFLMHNIKETAKILLSFHSL